MEKQTNCIKCDLMTYCVEYTTELDDGNIEKEFTCKKCATELKLDTDEEKEKKAKIWWRTYLIMRCGKAFANKEFERFYACVKKGDHIYIP